MRLFHTVSLLLAAVSWSIAQERNHGEGLMSEELESSEEVVMTLDSLILDDNEDFSVFGAQLLHEFHLHALDCKMNVSKLERHYQVRIGTLIKYYHSLEKIMSTPNFDNFNNEKRHDIESNFHRAMKETERERREKLDITQALCDTEQEEWLQEKLASAIILAKRLITQSTTQYIELLIKVDSFRSKIMAHMTTCKNGNGRRISPLNCAIDELEKLINFTSAFISAMRQVDLSSYRKEEGFDIQDSSFGSITVDQEVVGKATMGNTTPLDSESDASFGKAKNAPLANEVLRHQITVPRFWEWPVIVDLKEDEPDTESESPSTFQGTAAPTTNLQQDRHTLQETMLSAETSNSAEDAVSSYTNLQDAVTGRSQVSTFRNKQQTSPLSPSSGQEAEAEVVFDGPEDNRQETNFIARINYRLLLLLVLLGVTALAVAIAMTVLVTVTLHRKRHKMRLISENKLQEVMKKTGYVNPAYTFYTHC